jgi:hypothetical protein
MFACWNLVKPHHLNYFYPYDFKSMVTSYPSDCNLNPYFWPSHCLYIQQRHFNSPLHFFSQKCRSAHSFPMLLRPFNHPWKSIPAQRYILLPRKSIPTQHSDSLRTASDFSSHPLQTLIFNIPLLCHINIVSLSLFSISLSWGLDRRWLPAMAIYGEQEEFTVCPPLFSHHALTRWHASVEYLSKFWICGRSELSNRLQDATVRACCLATLIPLALTDLIFWIWFVAMQDGDNHKVWHGHGFMEFHVRGEVADLTGSLVVFCLVPCFFANWV